jgi:hypothetical protein
MWCYIPLKAEFWGEPGSDVCLVMWPAQILTNWPNIVKMHVIYCLWTIFQDEFNYDNDRRWWCDIWPIKYKQIIIYSNRTSYIPFWSIFQGETNYDDDEDGDVTCDRPNGMIKNFDYIIFPTVQVYSD